MTDLFVSFTRSYADDDIRPGPETLVDVAAWNNRVVALGGAYMICKENFGIVWR